MIHLTDMGGTMFFLNADHIEKMETVPDTVITMDNGNSYMVKETVDDVIRLALEALKRDAEEREADAPPARAGVVE